MLSTRGATPSSVRHAPEYAKREAVRSVVLSSSESRPPFNTRLNARPVVSAVVISSTPGSLMRSDDSQGSRLRRFINRLARCLMVGKPSVPDETNVPRPIMLVAHGEADGTLTLVLQATGTGETAPLILGSG